MEQIEEVLKKYGSYKFDNDQIEKIRQGLESGLNEKQISLYAKPEFNDGLMEQIRIGLENKLNNEQISLYAKPELSYAQMREIREELLNQKLEIHQKNIQLSIKERIKSVQEKMKIHQKVSPQKQIKKGIEIGK